MRLAEIDFTDLDDFANGLPRHLFDVHRREAPVCWHEPSDNFWSVASDAETFAVLRDPATCSSVPGGSRPYSGTLLQDLAIAGQVPNLDPLGLRVHTGIRHLVVELIP